MDFEKACAFARQWSARVDRQRRAEPQSAPGVPPATKALDQGALPTTLLDTNPKQREPSNSSVHP
jgi:hypothetical protein